MSVSSAMMLAGLRPASLSLLCVICALPGNARAADEIQLEELEVQGDYPGSAAEQSRPAQRLRSDAANETLGGYLDSLPNVDSSSYGEAVGRPVVRGMSGYRVGILQNDNAVSDLSAMSHDHAVAVAPASAERIELLKGPASLLYAARAGGIVRLSDWLDAPFPAAGLHGTLRAQLRPDPQGHSLDARTTVAGEKWLFRAGALDQHNNAYRDGHGNTIGDSDLETQQYQAALGWRGHAASEWLLSATRLEKDYGIPNLTDESTRIHMRSDDIGLKGRIWPDSRWLEEATVELRHNDYLHDETEGGRKDGLFGQKRNSASLNLVWQSARWRGETRLTLADSTLKVCHEHGACDDFADASRSGNPLGESVLQYQTNTGLPYSHGHPMPDTRSRTAGLSARAERSLNGPMNLTLGANLHYRSLSADPDNIQEQWVYPTQLDPHYYDDRNDLSRSLSAGLSGQLRRLDWQLSLSYLQRLPSADELYWNGFHHATDSYIFGNPDLDTERSVNIDADLRWQHRSHRLALSAFNYHFSDYIYQSAASDADGNTLSDPFHLSEVWFTARTGADFRGGSVRYENTALQLQGTPLTLWAQVDLIRSEDEQGDTLPRTAPLSTETGVSYDNAGWQARLSARHTHRADKLAPGENPTDGYTWLSAYLERRLNLRGQELQLWLKAENLLDEQAYNHLSVLKDTAPRPGRQISIGLQLNLP
ncbi:TonB-dependent receptor [Granulosicoccaceae sp. 1_MG-2023]|nr:TonB-dependent receptor [Granulosicoccaceae sp. 1_MG-2023]